MTAAANPPAPDAVNREEQNRRDNLRQLVNANWFFAVFILIGAIAAGRCARGGEHMAIVIVWAWACLAVGAFVGMLFGIPRAPKKADAARNGEGTYESNNNLIEVSDWLTKIIVGVGLVELSSIPARLKSMAAPLADCLGGDCGLAAAVGIIVFFIAAGFLFGYINARTFLAWMFSRTDAEMLARKVKEVEQMVTVMEQTAPGKKGGAADLVSSDAPVIAEPPVPTVPPTAPPPAPAGAPPATSASPPAASVPLANEPLRGPEGGGDLWSQDPNKGQFGGAARRNGRVLEAVITPAAGLNSAACRVVLRVRSEDAARPLTGSVTFAVHPTFPTARYTTRVRNGVAELRLTSWGAFTVGAIADSGATLLELDLADVPGGTRKFYES